MCQKITKHWKYLNNYQTMAAILYLHNRRQSKHLVLSGTMRFISVLVLQGTRERKSCVK